LRFGSAWREPQPNTPFDCSETERASKRLPLTRQSGTTRVAETEDLVNKGVIIRPGQAVISGPERTFIVSGVGRGGTSLVATLMVNAGIHMGEALADVVNEDLDFLAAFLMHQRQRMLSLIQRRNATHAVWGFKAPNVQASLTHNDIALFRNPHLILIFRDPLAVAERAVIAEHHPLTTALRDATDGLRNIVAFLHSTTCPALLLSYEKALLNPPALIDALAAFCGLRLTDDMRERLLSFVEPNSEAYMRKARRRFVGLVEHTINDVLFGWCWDVGNLDPVELDLVVGGRTVLTFKAADHRPDLMNAGYGNGNHGFAVDLTPLDLDSTSSVVVRASGRDYIVPGSGRALGDYRRL
jgi:hypothetical protein